MPREEAHLLGLALGQPDHVEQGHHAVGHLAAGHAVHHGVEAEVLLRGEVVVEGQVLEDEPDAGAHLVPLGRDVVAVDPARPAVAESSVHSIEIVVVLPAPLGPRNPNSSPGATSNDTSSTAVKPPNRFTRCSTSTRVTNGGARGVGSRPVGGGGIAAIMRR